MVTKHVTYFVNLGQISVTLGCTSVAVVSALYCHVEVLSSITE